LGFLLSGSWLRVALGSCACALALTTASGRISGEPQADSEFASRIEQFSEPGGYFDTDNLISNEQSYLHPMEALRARGVTGGVYIGVGPDQNFSYIAQVRPDLAFIVDVRRDNLLLHLLFKALFTLSDDRVDFLAGLFGRAPPEPASNRPRQAWRQASVRDLARFIDGAPATPASTAAALARVEAVVARFSVPLSRADRDTVARFHRAFIRAGLSLKFQSTGRAPLAYYPTYRDLLLETDRSGHEASYLASEEAFQFVKALQERDRVVPIVGNLAGDRALASIGRFMRDRGDRLAAFYTSNVELYLSQDGLLPRFLANVAGLPHDEHSVIIRSVFRTTVAESVPGYVSASFARPVADLLDQHARGGIRGYWDLIGP
jgi:hypothetical protein